MQYNYLPKSHRVLSRGLESHPLGHTQRHSSAQGPSSSLPFGNPRFCVHGLIWCLQILCQQTNVKFMHSINKCNLGSGFLWELDLTQIWGSSYEEWKGKRNICTALYVWASFCTTDFKQIRKATKAWISTWCSARRMPLNLALTTLSTSNDMKSSAVTLYRQRCYRLKLNVSFFMPDCKYFALYCALITSPMLLPRRVENTMYEHSGLIEWDQLLSKLVFFSKLTFLEHRFGNHIVKESIHYDLEFILSISNNCWSYLNNIWQSIAWNCRL